jgi:ABC-type sugar transport system permease subunit
MKPRTFAAFVAPSVILMLVFIALPLISVFVQSFYSTKQVFQRRELHTGFHHADMHHRNPLAASDRCCGQADDDYQLCRA